MAVSQKIEYYMIFFLTITFINLEYYMI